jgi:hypothetical protein
LIVTRGDHLQTLGGFTGGNSNQRRFESRALQVFDGSLAVARGHVLVRDDGATLAQKEPFALGPQARQQIVANRNGVTANAQRHFDDIHTAAE